MEKEWDMTRIVPTPAWQTGLTIRRRAEERALLERVGKAQSGKQIG